MYNLRNRIVEEDRGSHYSIYPSSKNMYHDLKEVFLWEGLKGDIEEFVVKFPNCQQVKTKNQKPIELHRNSKFHVGNWKK